MTEFEIWYKRFCIEGPPMSTKELMKEAYDEGAKQIKHYPAKDFYQKDGKLRVSLGSSVPAFNLKRGIKISKKELDKLIKYSDDCGFPVEANIPDAGFTEYKIDHPYYECTPLAESVLDTETNRWNHWAYIRL